MVKCQATFKNHCSFPHCDCDRKGESEILRKRLEDLEKKLNQGYVGGMTEYWERKRRYILKRIQEIQMKEWNI